MKLACDQHMPFPGHRTQQEVRQDAERKQILKSLGRDDYDVGERALRKRRAAA
jgi:hypothetical protein